MIISNDELLVLSNMILDQVDFSLQSNKIGQGTQRSFLQLITNQFHFNNFRFF